MLPSSDPVASIIPAMSLDSTSDNAMTALSRLALGPVNSKHYLAIFERFDDAGRTTTTWNWAACLFTLNWMVFRQLWGATLVYVAAAEGLALVMLGLGRSLLHWPQGVEWGILGTVALMAFAVPGLYGDAILYADIRKRVARALAASRTVPEACALLEKQASSRKRLQAIVLVNLVLVGTAGLVYLMLPADGTKPLAMEPSVTVAEATAAAAASSSQASAATESMAKASVQAPAAAPAPADVPTKAPAKEVKPEPMVPAPIPANAPKAPAQAPTQSATASQSTAQNPAPPPQNSPASAARTVPPTPAKASNEPTRRQDAASRRAQQAKSKTPAPATLPASASAPATSASETGVATVGAASGYYINVGLFADEANARKAQARLLNEGLPAFRQELNNANGRRLRVRVGPYDSRAKADAAAAAIRAMALDAVVFKK